MCYIFTREMLVNSKAAILVLVMLFSNFLFGCASSIKSQNIREVKLRDYRSIYVEHVPLGRYAVSVSSIGVGGGKKGVVGALTSSHAMSGEDQSVMASQDLEFALREIGFHVVNDPGEADAIVIFSIGTVRRDPVAGWIADRAVLSFNDVFTGEGLFVAHSRSSWVTLKISAHIEGLKKSVYKSY